MSRPIDRCPCAFLALSALGVLLSAAALAQRPLVAATTDGFVLEGPSADGLPHPEDFLGYRLGSRYTQHHRIVDYFEALAAASDRVRFEEYGRTVEDRPLTLVTLSSPANLARLDQIYGANLRLGAGVDTPAVDQPVIVWLAYGVHGNETSSAEAAMAVAWTLAAGGALDDVVVVIDPLVNPDGRERYVQWFREVSGRLVDDDPAALEHREPWPGGRFNHYLFDLNRDWTWLTQPETRQRLAAYRKIEPQVYVDVHEMSSDSTYYFAPPARPVLPLLDDAMDDLELFGRGNAAAFDARGWTFFVREVYDFFYPGYGDTYPTLRSGLGMTYEMAGGGGAGRLLRRDDGTRLSLADRVARHTVATLETARTAARHREHLLRRFAERRAEADGRVYVWRADQPEADEMAALLRSHGLGVRRLARDADARVTPIWPGESVSRSFPAGTWMATAEAPGSRLLRALMERQHDLPENFLERQSERLMVGEGEEIFDVTAWSLPLAYGVEAWSVDGRDAEGLAEAAVPTEEPATEPTTAETVAGPSPMTALGASRIGWRIPPQGLAGHRLTAALLAEGVKLRLATGPVSGDLYGADYEPTGKGSLLVPREGNDAGVADVLARLLVTTGLRAEPVASGLEADERNPGSGAFTRVTPPKIGLVAGDGVSATSHGALWHLFDHVVEMPVRRLDRERLDSDAGLDDLDVLVLPDGRWSGLPDSARAKLDRWMRGGGVLVAIGGAYDLAREAEWTKVTVRERGVELAEDDETAAPPESADVSVPGTFVAADIQIRHPLALGTGDSLAVLARGSRFLEPTGDPQIDLLTVRDSSPAIAGLLWPHLEAEVAGSLLVSTEGVGDGSLVVFAQDPAFRGFVRGTMDLLLDVVLFAPSL